MSGLLQYLHAQDPTDIPVAGDVPVFGTTGYVPTAGINGNVTAAGTLTSNAVIIGQGTKAVAALGSLGTTTTVLHGNAAGAPTFATVVEADITLVDTTTNNVTTSAHGFAPKGTAGTTQYWRQDWTLGTPSGAGDVTTTGSPASGNLTKFSGSTSITNADLTGDVTTAGGVATTLANSGVTAGDYGEAIVTFDAKGRATAAVQNYLQYRDQQTANTQGGTFTSGAWRTRVLNTEVTDVGGFGSLSSNQITLSSGTYRIFATAPAFDVNRHKARLQNVTDGATVLIGSSEYAYAGAGSDGSQSSSTISGIFTIAASKALEVQHQCQTTRANQGFGVESNFGVVEVYTVVELWKIG